MLLQNVNVLYWRTYHSQLFFLSHKQTCPGMFHLVLLSRPMHLLSPEPQNTIQLALVLLVKQLLLLGIYLFQLNFNEIATYWREPYFLIHSLSWCIHCWSEYVDHRLPEIITPFKIKKCVSIQKIRIHYHCISECLPSQGIGLEVFWKIRRHHAVEPLQMR